MLKVHFLNVGHGDCTVIEHPSGRITVIDINNGSELDPSTEQELLSRYHVDGSRADIYRALGYGIGPLLEQAGYDIKLTNPIEFLTTGFRGKSIWRYVQTHPDMDHMRGISVLDREFSIDNIWDVEHSKHITDFLRDSDRDDWAAYQRLRSGQNGTKVMNLMRGHAGKYWSEGDSPVDIGDGIEILAPTPQLLRDAGDNSNCMSYVLRLTCAGIKIILGGDADEAVWEDIYAHYGADLKCHVLKASHHGRDSGYHQPSVKAMAPQYTIVSVGSKPDTDASNKYRQYSSDGVWSTRWRGNITLTVNPDGSGNLDSEYQREDSNAPA
jgi:beta-lactamase superfamily II metal-dependent hydrolase